MSYNILIAKANCPVCGKSSLFDVQFKYGDTWQETYGLGEDLRWGGNDRGIPGLRKVAIEAIGGPCPHCNSNPLDFDIILEKDKIISLVPSSRKTDTSLGYRILEE